MVKENKVQILLVEDETNLGVTLYEYLNSIGHPTQWAKSGEEARNLFESKNPDILLMDIGLPDTDGRVLAQEFKRSGRPFVLLFLSAQNDPETRVEGLEIGAHDYITKPFALKELVLRLERILKSLTPEEDYPEEINIGKLKIKFPSFEIQDAAGKTQLLNQKEYGILEILYKNKNHAVRRESIIEEVWNQNSFPSNRTIDNYIVKLRKWCESDQARPMEIQSVRGIGYKMVINSDHQH